MLRPTYGWVLPRIGDPIQAAFFFFFFFGSRILKHPEDEIQRTARGFLAAPRFRPPLSRSSSQGVGFPGRGVPCRHRSSPRSDPLGKSRLSHLTWGLDLVTLASGQEKLRGGGGGGACFGPVRWPLRKWLVGHLGAKANSGSPTAALDLVFD